MSAKTPKINEKPATIAELLAEQRALDSKLRNPVAQNSGSDELNEQLLELGLDKAKLADQLKAANDRIAELEAEVAELKKPADQKVEDKK